MKASGMIMNKQLGNRETPPFIHTFSAEHQNVFVQQQKHYHKITMDEFVEFFQICYLTDQPVYWKDFEIC